MGWEADDVRPELQTWGRFAVRWVLGTDDEGPNSGDCTPLTRVAVRVGEQGAGS